MHNLARESLLPPTPPTTNPWDLNFLSHILHTLTQKELIQVNSTQIVYQLSDFLVYFQTSEDLQGN